MRKYNASLHPRGFGGKWIKKTGAVGPYQHKLNRAPQKAKFSKPMKRNLAIGAAVVGVAAGGYAGGKYALNNPQKLGGLGRKLDTGITYAYWRSIVPGPGYIPWEKEIVAHRHRSATAVRRFYKTRNMYRQGKLTSPVDKMVYREFTHQRAVHRLRRIKGQQSIHFNYGSGMPNKRLNNKLIAAGLK